MRRGRGCRPRRRRGRRPGRHRIDEQPDGRVRPGRPRRGQRHAVLQHRQRLWLRPPLRRRPPSGAHEERKRGRQHGGGDDQERADRPVRGHRPPVARRDG